MLCCMHEVIARRGDGIWYDGKSYRLSPPLAKGSRKLETPPRLHKPAKETSMEVDDPPP